MRRVQLHMKRRYLAWFAGITLALIVAGELVARFYYGLGTPPLYVSHPTIEYLLKPNQDVWRFGNRYFVNQYGMRSDPFDLHKKNDEFRVLIFGDSVINGGNQTDQAELATTLLQTRLAEFKKSAMVGNISAGSWGPGNWLSYANEYGFFDADVVILVLSSHDSTDNPEYLPLDEITHPTRRPVSALSEGLTRYLPQYIFGHSKQQAATSDDADRDAQLIVALDDLEQFLSFGKMSVSQVVVIQHWEQGELELGKPGFGSLPIRNLCEKLGIPCASCESHYRQSMQNGENIFRDHIHLNRIGQKVLAEVLFHSIQHPMKP